MVTQLEIIEKKAVSVTSSPPVLFVHGAWHGAWCWEENFMDYFSERGFDCYAVSMRGHGESECDRFFHLCGIDDYVEDLAEAVDRIGEAPVLIAHSMGGAVAQHYLESHGAPALVLMASVPPRGVLRFAGRVARNHPRTFLKYLVTMNPGAAVEKPEVVRALFFSSSTPDEEFQSHFSRLGRESERASLDMMFFRWPRAARVQCPRVLVLGAAGDTTFVPGEVRATARAFKVDAEIFENMGHDMMLEPGWEAVADRIIEWLWEQGI